MKSKKARNPASKNLASRSKGNQEHQGFGSIAFENKSKPHANDSHEFHCAAWSTRLKCEEREQPLKQPGRARPACVYLVAARLHSLPYPRAPPPASLLSSNCPSAPRYPGFSRNRDLRCQRRRRRSRWRYPALDEVARRAQYLVVEAWQGVWWYSVGESGHSGMDVPHGPTTHNQLLVILTHPLSRSKSPRVSLTPPIRI